jgi:hypothetical protein
MRFRHPELHEAMTMGSGGRGPFSGKAEARRKMRLHRFDFRENSGANLTVSPGFAGTPARTFDRLT